MSRLVKQLPFQSLYLLIHSLHVLRPRRRLKINQDSTGGFRDQEVVLIQIPVQNAKRMQSSHDRLAGRQVRDGRMAANNVLD